MQTLLNVLEWIVWGGLWSLNVLPGLLVLLAFRPDGVHIWTGEYPS